MLDCTRYHHGRALSAAKLPLGSPAYIAYIADNIAAAADRRLQDTTETFGFVRSQPLSPVFLHLNGEHGGTSLEPTALDGTLRQPIPTTKLTQSDYQALLSELSADLDGLPIGEQWVNSLLCVMETFTSTIPASTSKNESPDISLFDHVKITAAAGCCISEWLLAQGISDYQKTLMKQEKAFFKKPIFLLYSADFSGIQKFIYTVSIKNALRSLRSRSFFLEFVMEHYIDELLTVCGLSRANLLYGGGGHCYILLPNTDEVTAKLEAWNTCFNEWLAEEFGVSLYLAHGWTECTANDLCAKDDGDYSGMFRRVSSAIAHKKLHRYTPAQILRMNKPRFDTEGRECRVCGRIDALKGDKDGETAVCRWCGLFEELSRDIQEKSIYLVEPTRHTKESFVLPTVAGSAVIHRMDEAPARERLQKELPLTRFYTKNVAYTGAGYASRIYVGDYAYSNELEALAKESEGIERLGVCRMDVDDLGQAFVGGFIKRNGAKLDERYNTISRTAAFSRQLSWFFKCYINGILEGLKVSIVYSGGDDVFLVGAWNDTIESAVRIRSAFREYTCGSLSISGGVALFDPHHPIRLAANQTAELEDLSKQREQKDGITLFAPEAQYCFGWSEFIGSVRGKKLKLLNRFFTEDNNRGNSFLYRLTELLRGTERGEKINLARYAYTLARLEPKKKDPTHGVYQEFSEKMYRWAGSDEDRKELITAIYIHVYEKRKRKE